MYSPGAFPPAATWHVHPLKGPARHSLLSCLSSSFFPLSLPCSPRSVFHSHLHLPHKPLALTLPHQMCLLSGIPWQRPRKGTHFAFLFIVTPSPPHGPAPRSHQLWRATLQQPYHIFKELSSVASCLNCFFLGNVSHSQLSLQSPTAKDASLPFWPAAARSMGAHVVLAIVWPSPSVVWHL